MSEKTVTSAYVTLRSKILRFAARFFPAEEDADDALQEAFCRLWQRHDNINTISEAEALAKTTVRNLAIDAHRHREVARAESLDAGMDAVDSSSSPLEAMERNESRLLVEKIISDNLTELQRKVLRMRDFEERSYADIASLLEMEEEAVRAHLSRARKKLRKCYLNYTK